MACFLVPAAEAVVTTVAAKALSKKEAQGAVSAAEPVKLPFAHKLKWLNNMLWGGSALLAFEHLWHGEIVPWAPFLTAAGNPADFAAMLHEMSTVGVTMALVVSAVWGVMVAVSSEIERHSAPFRQEGQL